MLSTRLQFQASSLNQIAKRNFGSANIKALKLRIKSVQGIRKITKAMKMVAASKLKKDVERLTRGKEWGIGIVEDIMENDSFLQSKKQTKANPKTLIVPITGDKGLCGGCNSQIVKHVREMVSHHPEKYSILPVGEKSSAGLARNFPNLVGVGLSGLGTPMNYWTAAAVASFASKFDKDADEMVVVYNHFKNSMSNFPVEAVLLSPANFAQNWKNMVKYEKEEPTDEYNLPYYYELYTSSRFYHAFINAAASEQSSRMNAMEGATKNAGEMIEALQLKYNQARQAKITMELIEIISGANAV